MTRQAGARFLKLMGASLALAGVGTRLLKQPSEKIVPYVRQPEEWFPASRSILRPR